MNERIRLLLVDDHEMVRAGFRALFAGNREMEVIGEASDGEDAVRMALSSKPDVVLMDLALGNMSGIEATRRIREADPEIQVLAVTAHDSPEYFFELMKCEAVGYILKEATPGELFTAIRAAHRGEAYFYPSIARYLLNDYMRRVRSGREERTHYDGLTEREREILRLIASGYSNREIAEQLVISVNTVEAHRGHIIQKLNLHTRAELVRYAIRCGLINVGD
jgi:two-component system response regulator NreC